MGHDIGGRPLLLVGVVLVVTSIQFLTTGILAELLSRIYFESSSLNSYVIRPNREEDDSRGWHKAP